jgi:hypothetical protein
MCSPAVRHTAIRDDPRPRVRIHESAYVDEPDHRRARHRHSVTSSAVVIGSGSLAKTWSPVALRLVTTSRSKTHRLRGRHPRTAFRGPCVFTNVANPRSEIVRKEYRATLVKRGIDRRQCHHRCGHIAHSSSRAPLTLMS